MAAHPRELTAISGSAQRPGPHSASFRLELLLAALFVAIASTQLEALLPNFDEGVYILQGRWVRAGQVPYVDFFHHQTPLYPYALAAFGALGPGSLFVQRLLSLLATAVAGVVLARIGRRLLPAAGALAAAALFYAAPLQRAGLLALPNGLMVLMSTLGVYGVLFHEDRRAVTAGALALVAAVFLKPLAIPVVLAVVAVVAVTQRSKLATVVFAGALGGLAAWAALHLATAGAFTEVLLLQAGRFAGKSGFQVMMQLAPFAEVARGRGVTSATGWNLSEHVAAFALGLPLNANLALVLAAGLGVQRSEHRGLLLAWLLFPLGFSLFVWEPVWDHYFVQYLAPLALLAGVPFATAWERARVPAALALAALLALSAASWARDPGYVGRARSLPRGAGAVFTFEPLVNVAAGTEPACGVADPLNVYGRHNAAALAGDGPLARFVVEEADLVACLQAHPEVPIIVNRFYTWFAGPELRRFVDAADPARVVRLAP